jgi:hypothetical protein
MFSGSWKPQVIGYAMILFSGIAAIFPDSVYGKVSSTILFVLSGIAHTYARQKDVTSAQDGAGSPAESRRF